MELKNLPDITFAESDPQAVDLQIVEIMEKLLGRKLSRADPIRLFLRGIEAIIVQQRVLIDETAKQNLLAYSTGDRLDHIGVLVGTDRLQASAASTTLHFELSAARESATLIPAGTRATAGDGVLFATDQASTIDAGKTSVDIESTCTTSGTSGNGYKAGEINRLADPVPFIAAVTNTTTSAGGADVEADDDYRERIHEAPEQYSTAGPTGAYEYFTKKASALITDVAVTSPSPAEVVVWPLLTGGEMPDDEILNKVSDVLNDRTVRPLTDKVTVEKPTAVSYNIKVSYWIDRADATEAPTIQQQVETAVKDYALWQKSKLGRDINPTELYYRIRAAGAKRAEVTEPAYTVVDRKKGQVAVDTTASVTFGGLEDD